MSSSSKRPLGPKANLVQAFRGEQRAATPIHPRELALVIIATLHLCFLAWATGGRTPWAQAVSGGLGLIALVVALLPRTYEGEYSPDRTFRLHTFPRLLHFPPFWIGLIFLGYVTCQALNPAWVRATAGPYWWVAQVPHTSWLPSGVSAPFEKMNAWRLLAFWGGAWALGCALWIGLTRRVSAQAVLIALIINGCILAIIGILQKITGATEILWFIKSPASYFVSTFVYKNHGAAYFNIILVVAVGFMVWHYARSLRRLERSSPAPVFAFAAIVLASIVFMSVSRTAMLLLAAFALVSIFVGITWRSRERDTSANPFVTGSLAVGALVIITVAISYLNLDDSIAQIKRLTAEDKKASIETRVILRDATLELFEAEPLTGWGAGSFRHIFPMVQRNHPSIMTVGRRPIFWDHAHNDYVQYLAELGVIGFAFPVIALFWMVVKFCRVGALRTPGFLLLFIGLGLPLAHAWVDFPLSNCAIFTTYVAVWVLVVRWAELETSRA